MERKEDMYGIKESFLQDINNEIAYAHGIDEKRADLLKKKKLGLLKLSEELYKLLQE